MGVTSACHGPAGVFGIPDVGSHDFWLVCRQVAGAKLDAAPHGVCATLVGACLDDRGDDWAPQVETKSRPILV